VPNGDYRRMRKPIRAVSFIAGPSRFLAMQGSER